MKKRCKMKKGMTLIEAIISVALLSLLIIPISGMILNSTRTNRKAEIKQNAAYLGQQVLEEIGTYDYVTLNNDGGTVFFQLLDGDKIEKQADGSYEGEILSGNLPSDYEVKVLLEKYAGLKYEDKNTLDKYDSVPWRFDFTGNTFKVLSPTSFGNYGERMQSVVINNKPLIINIDSSSNIEMVNLTTPTGRAELTKNGGDDSKILLYLTDTNLVTNYPDIEIRNKGSNNVNVYVVKKNSDNKIKVSSIGSKVLLYDNILATEENKVGELYNIKVTVLDKSTGDEIFNGHTTSNIVFK